MARTITLLKNTFGKVYVCNNCNPYHLVVPDWHEWKEVEGKAPSGSGGRPANARPRANGVRKAKSSRGKGTDRPLFKPKVKSYDGLRPDPT